METKKIISIIVAIVAAIAVIGGGVFFWMNQPINKINKAMETENLEVVVTEYAPQSRNAKEFIQNSICTPTQRGHHCFCLWNWYLKFQRDAGSAGRIIQATDHASCGVTSTISMMERK